VDRKPDDLAIGAFFDELASQPWLGFQRRLWPQFFFHVTDAHNAAAILSSGRLMCRSRAEREGWMRTDNASAEILTQSPPWLFDFVRLYFRPRTPTFWNNEGMRPLRFRAMGAHCPVPIALLFEAKEIAGQTGVQFSDGNLASVAARRGADLAFLRSLDFRDVYHNFQMMPEDKVRLTARRQAEIIVPGQLGLDALRWVVARSGPELTTLLALLEETTWSRESAMYEFRVHSSLFHCRWSYIERIDLIGNQVRFLFNPDSETPGPFDVSLTWQDPTTGHIQETQSMIRAVGTITVPVPQDFRGRVVELAVKLDDSLAYKGTLRPVPSSVLL
jgi:hypothetical protein